MRAILVSVSAIGFVLSASAQQKDTKPLVLPPPPPPVKTTLPLNAQVTPNGVYVPVSKSGNTGVSVNGLTDPKPGEAGGSVSLTIKTK